MAMDKLSTSLVYLENVLQLQVNKSLQRLSIDNENDDVRGNKYAEENNYISSLLCMYPIRNALYRLLRIVTLTKHYTLCNIVFIIYLYIHVSNNVFVNVCNAISLALQSISQESVPFYDISLYQRS